MKSMTLKALAAAVLISASALSMAANDGEVRSNEILNSAPEYREAWQDAIAKQERLPEWVMNLSGAGQPLQTVEEDGEQYLVGPLCETEEKCKTSRLIVAFSWDKDDAYGVLVDVPAALPEGKTPSSHATYKWLGKPDEGMQAMLKEQLSKTQGWY
ncbi:inhibitor of vertebrate lysozyme family protein [Pseudomonas sp. nanlin1]|uniref:inhibitor of vertebrate lysozyme family protein n=1 Tax=Pseudomonas sp. nanlin1 TaxID=3040605 RepID=UPI00388F770F